MTGDTDVHLLVTDTLKQSPHNGPHDLVMVSLCIQIAIDKRQLRSLSTACACTYHNPTSTMGFSVHNIDFTKPLVCMTPYTWSEIVNPDGCTAKFSKTTLEAAYFR